MSHFTLRTHVGMVIAALPLLLGLVSCGGGEKTLTEVDPDAVALNPTFAQVEALLDRECLPCHSGQAEPDLDSCENIIRNSGDIREEVFENNSMPPGAWPRLTSEEKLLLQRWFAGGSVAPCN